MFVLKLNNISFEKRALRLFKEQSQKCLPYHQYLQFLKTDVESISSLAEIPFLPIEFFKTEQIICKGQKIEEIFLKEVY